MSVWVRLTSIWPISNLIQIKFDNLNQSVSNWPVIKMLILNESQRGVVKGKVSKDKSIVLEWILAKVEHWRMAVRRFEKCRGFISERCRDYTFAPFDDVGVEFVYSVNLGIPTHTTFHLLGFHKVHQLGEYYQKTK